MTARPSLADLPLADLARIALAVTCGRAEPPAPRSVATAIVAGALAVTTGAACAVFLLVALWIGVRPMAGPLGTPLVIAGALALLTIGAVWTLRRARRPSPVPLPPATASSVPLDELARLVVAHKGPVLLAALLAGVVAAGTSK